MYKTFVARITAATKQDLDILNKILPIHDLSMSQIEGPGFKLTRKQDLSFLKNMIKQNGAPKDWGSRGNVVHRVWNVNSTKVAVDYQSDSQPALVYLLH